jgi:hypothetical protein
VIDAGNKPGPRHIYFVRGGRQEVNSGFLPPGFLAIDISHHLNLPLFDPDSTTAIDGLERYMPVDPTIGKATGSE